MTTDINLTGSPFLIVGQAAVNLEKDLRSLTERISLLRSQGRLTHDTLENYYGEKRFEQVAESNAIEGNPLTVGETELAVLKGVTISGHDPAFSRDAQALHKALMKVVELARDSTSTNIEQVNKINSLILGDRPGAGAFRQEPVRIRGSKHKPPKEWKQVMAYMESWEQWSAANPSLHPALRSAALHAWLAHIHPYIDGNGRTARAIGNLELIRAGFPPIIIRRHKDRDRYLDALAEADQADLGPFVELVLERLGDAVRDLERAAVRGQQYDAAAARIRRAQERHLAIWNAAVDLLFRVVVAELEIAVEIAGGECDFRRFENTLSLDDYVELCAGSPVSKSWAFRLKCSVPGLPPVERLAWIGYQSDDIRTKLDKVPQGPSLFWSRKNPDGYPTWTRHGADTVGTELTITPGKGDRWHVLTADRSVREYPPTVLANSIARTLVSLLTAENGSR